MVTHTRKQINVILTITVYFGAKRQPVLFIALYIANPKNGTTALFVPQYTVQTHNSSTYIYCISIYTRRVHF